MTLQQIDQFRVIKLLGKGGQGEVYAVEDDRNQRFALKLLLPQVSDRAAADRMNREFQVVSKLNHPGVIKVFEQGYHNNRPYFTMELISGFNLKEFCRREFRLQHRFDVIIQACNALGYIHDYHLIHRDLKPSNLLLTEDFKVKLMDFGLVKALDASLMITKSHQFMGTLNYVSPEQIMGEEIDHRSDIYSMGIIIYEIFSGRLPFEANSLAGLIGLHLTTAPPSLENLAPNCPLELSSLCMQMLKKSPWDRPSSMKSIEVALRKIAGESKVDSSVINAVEHKAHIQLNPKFTGRTNEVNFLMQPLKSPGDFKIRLINGPHGMGKTRLLNESLKIAVAENISFTRLRCSGQMQQNVDDELNFFEMIVDQIKKHSSVLGDLAELLPELSILNPAFRAFDPSGERIQSADPHESRKEFVIRYLSAIIARMTQHRPWHIVWDDIHLAGDLQIEVIRDLISFRHHEAVNCVLWATIRNDDFNSQKDMKSFENLFMGAENVQKMELRTIDDMAAAEMVASLLNQSTTAPLTREIANFCQGYPAIVVETIRNWIAGGELVKSGNYYRFSHDMDSQETLAQLELEDLVQQQMLRVSEMGLQMLTWIVVLEQDAYLELLKYLMICSEEDLLDTLNDLIFRRLIESRKGFAGEYYVLTSGVLKRLILNRHDSDTLSNFHLDAAGVMEDLGGEYANPLRLAEHQELAGEFDLAAKNFFQAAEDAYHENQTFMAKDRIEHCLRVLPRLPRPNSRRSRLLKIRVYILAEKIISIVGSMDVRKEIVKSLVELLPEITEYSLMTDAYAQVISFHISNYNIGQAEKHLEDFREKTENASRKIPSLYYQKKGFLEFYKHNLKKSLGFFKQAIIMGLEQWGDVRSVSSLLTIYAKVLMLLGYLNAASEMLKFNLSHLPPKGKLFQRGSMLSDLGNVEFYKENHHAARKYLKKGLIIHKKIGSEYFRGCDLHDIGLTYWKTQDLIHADQYVSEAMEVFQTLKTPRELLMNTVSVMGLKRAQGKFTEALDVYKKVIQIVNRERIFDIHPAVESGFFRVYSTVGNRDELRNLLKRLVLSNRNETEPYRSNEICRIVGLQLIAEGRYRAADKILSHNAKFDGQSYVVDVPLEYQLFILRIHYDPSTDHSDILSNDLFRFMKKLTYLRFEASWLKKLKMYYKNRTKIERESGKVFLKELSGYDNILGRYWMICSLEYFARMNNDNQMIFKARKEREMLLRDMTEGFTPEEKKRFLSRPVLTRI